MKQCRNCQTTFEGTFCPSCGQKDIDLERALGELVGEVLRETLDVDGRAWRTIRTLFLRPGELTSDYLLGRRRSYTPPLRLYLAISLAFFVLMAWVASEGGLLEQGQSREADAASQAQFLSNDLPKMMFVLLPVFAVLVKVVFWRRLYFDHLIYSVHLLSAAYVILALMLPWKSLRDNIGFRSPCNCSYLPISSATSSDLYTACMARAGSCLQPSCWRF